MEGNFKSDTCNDTAAVDEDVDGTVVWQHEPFLHLPDDVWDVILSFLRVPSIIQLGFSCKGLGEVVFQHKRQFQETILLPDSMSGPALTRFLNRFRAHERTRFLSLAQMETIDESVVLDAFLPTCRLEAIGLCGVETTESESIPLIARDIVNRGGCVRHSGTDPRLVRLTNPLMCPEANNYPFCLVCNVHHPLNLTNCATCRSSDTVTCTRVAMIFMHGCRGCYDTVCDGCTSLHQKCNGRAIWCVDCQRCTFCVQDSELQCDEGDRCVSTTVCCTYECSFCQKTKCAGCFHEPRHLRFVDNEEPNPAIECLNCHAKCCYSCSEQRMEECQTCNNFFL